MSIVYETIVTYDASTSSNVQWSLGEQLNADIFKVSDRPFNFFSVNTRGELEAIPTDKYLDYNGNMLVWGASVVTKEQFDDFLQSSYSLTGVITPQMLDNTKVLISNRVTQLQESFIAGVLRILAEKEGGGTGSTGGGGNPGGGNPGGGGNTTLCPRDTGPAGITTKFTFNMLK